LPKLPRISARAAVAALKRLGFEEHRQSGSHLILKHPSSGARVIVPVHTRKDLPVGTLSRILKSAGVSVEEFVRVLP